MKFFFVALLGAVALAGCQSTSSPAAPPVTAAMVKSGGRGQVNMAILSSGRSAFVSRCAACHALPKVNEYPRSEWPGFVADMSKRSGLNPGQSEAVLAYILAAHE